MDISQVVDVLIRSASNHHDPDDVANVSGSGSPSSDAHDDHSVHAHPGTVLFLFVAIGVGGE